MLDNIQGFHIEPTNICTLKCPRCARTDFINKFPTQWKNKQLDLNNLKTFIDINVKNKIFNLCGNYGDPIYYDKLIDLVTWIKYHNGIVKIVTNGSYKTKFWWQNLCSLLTKEDSIYFAIDGIPGNFTNYRINADWKSIKVGIEQATAFTTAIWKYIPFAFNESNINEAEKLAADMGMSFLVEYTDRWNSESDPLKSNNFLGPRYEHVVNWIPSKKSQIDPACKKTNSEHYISADGYYLPCCKVGDHRFFYQSEFYKNSNEYKISNTTLSEVLSKLSIFYNTIEIKEPKYCKFNCVKT